jgi:putative membrane-bound dehydrogenase-like protein
MQRFRILLVALCSLFASCDKSQNSGNDEHSAEASFKDLKVHDGLKVQLFASEPMFSNPTNIAVDARGRVWVTEAYNYRNDVNVKNPVREQGDRIVILEDTDGDGKADESKVFYQGTDVNAALGILVIGKKVIVSCSPNIFVFTDENGDDTPDKKEILFQGINGNQNDHGAHAFTFGHDGRFYFNMGNAGNVLVSARGDTVVDVHGRKVITNAKPFRQGLALRCDPDGSNVEVLGHNFRNNYELAMDPYGTVWQSDNDDDGNKGTRINYVMEQGNFGYTDEITGAGWNSRRTNMEKEIPLRHWHLNDPGVVPNVLQTGAGSPAGITIYEGSMLPEKFYGQLIHAEPGNNVVRSYIVKEDGAGYSADIVNILEGQKDQWFRPVDVTAAPDGSLIIADWYDPGVGGHQAGDLDRGRIYRVTTEDDYKLPAFDLKSPEGSVKALTNPNSDVRYQAYTSLEKSGDESRQELLKLWKSDNPRHRAQAFWLLANNESTRSDLFNEAITDKDQNIRITALRAARKLKYSLESLIKNVINDPSAQVRREAILSLRGMTFDNAADLWADLALKHDGKDRWCVEALGIASDGNADKFFKAWKSKVGKDWNSDRNRDIVWRIRAKEALPMLGQIIAAADEGEVLRYFRAFDFHSDPSKQQVLAQIATTSKDIKVLYALKHMDVTKFKMTPTLASTLNRVLDQYKNKIEFVELASAFQLKNKSEDLLSLSLQYPDSTAGKEAARLLLNWDRSDLFNKVLARNNADESQALVKTLRAHIYDRKAMAVMEKIMTDSANNIEVRKLAVRSFAGPWSAEDRLLEMARDNKIPSDLHLAAAGVFQTAWRSNIREDGPKYLKLPGSKEGESLPTVAVLADKKGTAEKGKEVFSNICSNCHQVDKQGVNFGPDLSEIGDKLSREAMYTSILYPDQGISFGYEGYRFKLKDGSTAFGRILSETTDKIDLQYISTTQTINKSEIVARIKLENSLMPSNLQSTISQDELVDLVEYLTTLKKQNAELTLN